MAVKKITRRWLLNSFAVIVVIIVAVIIAASAGMGNYYYASVRQVLSTRADNIVAAFRQYSEDPTVTDLEVQVQQYVSTFSQRDNSVELMTLDAEGKVNHTSSGFPLEEGADLSDYESAQVSADQTAYLVGELNAQQVMAYTVMLPAGMQQNSLSAVRVVTGLGNVNRQIAFFVLALLALGALVLGMVLFSSSYFISSIVNPIGEVGETARRIAQGDFAARLQKKNDDEIGELCDIINYMAGELATAEQVKNDFISSVSHELRTPLTAIQGWAETILADGGDDRDILQRGMRVITSETTRLSQMVEELLDFSRMQSGRLRLVKSRIDVLAELSEAVLMYTEKARREGIALEYDDPDLIVPVYGDKNKLRQVFVNIIDNAIKYSDSGGTVAVHAEAADGALRITVTDTGVGISEDALPQIKQKFYKADSTRRGSGIGLAVADEIVSRHGGTLSLASRQRYGTTVSIVLPVYTGQDDAVQVEDTENA